MRKFRLVQNMGGLEAGSIFTESNNGYVHELPHLPGYAVAYVGFPKYLVEHQPSWFEEIETRWRPKVGDSYYFIVPDGDISVKMWTGGDPDKFFYEMGNCFKTCNEARRGAELLKQTLVKFHEEKINQ